MATESRFVRIRKVIEAPRQRVFRAWTTLEEVSKWWGPPGYSTLSVEIDLRVGGKYRIAMQAPGNERGVLSGTYREVHPPERLAYTWSWEGTTVDGKEVYHPETLVTVEFHDLGGRSTEIILTHGPFSDDELYDMHDQGWLNTLAKLEELLQDAQIDPHNRRS